MALRQMVFSARLVDGMGQSRSCHAYYQRDDAITVATLVGALESYAADLEAMTDATITRLSLSIDDVTFSATVKTGGAPIEQTGVLNFTATGSAKRWGWAIPAFTNSKLTGDRINLADADTEVVIAEFTAGGFTNDHYQPLTALADAFVSFRRDRKQLQRSSFETA